MLKKLTADTTSLARARLFPSIAGVATRVTLTVTLNRSGVADGEHESGRLAGGC